MSDYQGHTSDLLPPSDVILELDVPELDAKALILLFAVRDIQARGYTRPQAFMFVTDNKRRYDDWKVRYIQAFSFHAAYIKNCCQETFELNIMRYVKSIILTKEVIQTILQFKEGSQELSPSLIKHLSEQFPFIVEKDLHSLCEYDLSKIIEDVEASLAKSNDMLDSIRRQRDLKRIPISSLSGVVSPKAEKSDTSDPTTTLHRERKKHSLVQGAGGVPFFVSSDDRWLRASAATSSSSSVFLRKVSELSQPLRVLPSNSTSSMSFSSMSFEYDQKEEWLSCPLVIAVRDLYSLSLPISLDPQEYRDNLWAHSGTCGMCGVVRGECLGSVGGSATRSSAMTSTRSSSHHLSGSSPTSSCGVSVDWSKFLLCFGNSILSYPIHMCGVVGSWRKKDEDAHKVVDLSTLVPMFSHSVLRNIIGPPTPLSFKHYQYSHERMLRVRGLMTSGRKFMAVLDGVYLESGEETGIPMNPSEALKVEESLAKLEVGEPCGSTPLSKKSHSSSQRSLASSPSILSGSGSGSGRLHSPRLKHGLTRSIVFNDGYCGCELSVARRCLNRSYMHIVSSLLMQQRIFIIGHSVTAIKLALALSIFCLQLHPHHKQTTRKVYSHMHHPLFPKEGVVEGKQSFFPLPVSYPISSSGSVTKSTPPFIVLKNFRAFDSCLSQPISIDTPSIVCYDPSVDKDVSEQTIVDKLVRLHMKKNRESCCLDITNGVFYSPEPLLKISSQSWLGRIAMLDSLPHSYPPSNTQGLTMSQLYESAVGCVLGDILTLVGMGYELVFGSERRGSEEDTEIATFLDNMHPSDAAIVCRCIHACRCRVENVTLYSHNVCAIHGKTFCTKCMLTEPPEHKTSADNKIQKVKEGVIVGKSIEWPKKVGDE
ncbi:hypothetical protein ADUPG1_013959 [Aduncisulcus paluster]|uniref:UDENN FLCN/SMCR8-type domain-containing protein n=1 Tax=Aduncisulcus paluster TaxID=2918883 RepID=A0ABQ5K556_9EUKA|nr:hypothetical protein ADUPG1_013959 [Aduncisulcus paluster]